MSLRGLETPCVLWARQTIHKSRMRAKTSDFLKVLNRAKIEDETNKKKPSYMGAKSPFV